MSDREIIEQRVGRLRLVRRVQLMLDFMVRGLFWGAIPAGLLILATRVFILPIQPGWEYAYAGGLVVATMLGFMVASLFVRISPLGVANDIDVSLGLKERVSSALSLSKPEEGTGIKAGGDPFVRNLVSDAANTVGKLPLKTVYPWRIPRAWKLALPALLVAAAISFVPQLNLFASEQDREEYQLVQKQGQQLEELAEAVKKEAEKQQDPVLDQQAKEIKRIGEMLSQGNIKKKQALKEMQRLKDKFQTQSQSAVPDGQRDLASKFLDELKNQPATRELSEMLEAADMQGAQQQLSNLLQNLADGKMTPSDQQMMEDMLEAVEQTLDSAEANNPEAQQLKQQLEQLKQQMEQDQQLRDAVESAMDAFEQDVSKLSESLQESGMGEQSQQIQQQMQQMQQQIEQQGVVSPQSLQQMMQQLQNTQQSINNNSSLSQQQQNQLSQQAQQAMSHLQSQSGQQGQLGQQNQQMMQNRQQMSQNMGKTARECSGGG